jgi:23S rRNA pseudouridine2605 synthase
MTKKNDLVNKARARQKPARSGFSAPRTARSGALAQRNAPAGHEAEQSVRINKALADAGVCSRRAADELVAQGVVTVNGVVVDTPGVKVVPDRDELCVRGKKIFLKSSSSRSHTYLMMHKPVEVVTTVSDPEGRRTVIDILPPLHRKKRLFPVGRLDFFSEGLLLLTDDGVLTHRLTHPSWHLPKTYLVKVRGVVQDNDLQAMRKGMTLAEGEKLAPVEVEVLSRHHDWLLLEMTLFQGINRQIRRMCRDAGLTVLSLHRVRQGPLSLGELRTGEVRELTDSEIAALKASVDL